MLETKEMIRSRSRTAPPGVALGAPRVADGAAIHRLVDASKPLDSNSTYAYLLLCRHFADTCVQAKRDGRTVGFVSAYRPPRTRDMIFVWQIAVAQDMRGRGLGRAMLQELLAREAVRGCRYMETTVSPSNEPSRRLFHSLARELGAPVEEGVLFQEGDFGGERHERETLIRIGPFAGTQPEGGRRNEP